MYDLASIESAADRWKQREEAPAPPDPWRPFARAVLHDCAAEARQTLDNLESLQTPSLRSAALQLLCDLSEGLDRLLPHLRHEAAMEAYRTVSNAFDAILDTLFPDPDSIDPGLLRSIPDKLIRG